ncbi:MAG: SRPBCC family protein [Burkholderiaceae bacterium]
MRLLPASIVAVFSFTLGTALAAAPVLKVTESVQVDAPASEVWKRVKNFGGLDTWHPAVAKDEIVSGKNNRAGAVRLLTLKDGGTIKEELLKMNDAGKNYRYRIVEGVLPVSDYASTIAVQSTGKGKSKVTWSGHFKRKNTGDNPGEKENDKTATDTISAVYKAGLDNLKQLSESASK